ncbi:mitochondrial substrate carrier family protein [Salix suchowensis]|nr:mitochondrial substrate carrier family protein [Salix suchowensis]
MQTEARVGVVAEGGPRALNSEPKKHRQLQQQHQQSQIGTVSHLVAGGVAGALSKTCTAPLARLTILFQLQGMHSDVATLRKASIWHEASRVIREEGFSALWKGNLVTIAHRLPYSSVNFYAYERYKQLLHMIPGLEIQRKSAGVDLLVHFVGGGLAGITAASATYPLILGIHHALKTISREEGVFGLYKGLGATLLGVGPSIAISFSVYESLRSFWQSRRPHDSTVAVSLACGSLSGIASSTATFPLDLVRRRKQLEGAGGRARVYTTGLLGTFKHIIQTEGFQGLYRGIMPEYCKVVPGVGICFMTYETLKLLLADTQNYKYL